MALPFLPSDAGLLLLQAAIVLAPRRVAAPGVAARTRGVAWALVPVASIVVVVFAIRYVSDTATALTYLALVAVPPLAAAALGWAARGASPPLAAGAAALFAVAWAAGGSLAGEAAAALLSGLSCVTLGVLLAAVTPPRWLKAGILAMAAADTWLVVADLLQAPNAVLLAAHPPGGLPRLQSEIFGSATMGYGDLFVAGLLGALLARERRGQLGPALATLLLASAFDVLFLVVDELPATVPVATALIAVEAWSRRRPGVGGANAGRRGSPRAGATPRRAR